MVSNKTLAFLLVLAVITSLGGLFMSLDRLSRIVQITGYASTGTGTANVSITGVNSITISDSLINFGACTPNPTSGILVSSNDTGSMGNCTLNSSTDKITVTNDGNSFVNLTLSSNALASTLIGGTGPSFLFTSKNGSSNNGCPQRATYCTDGLCGCAGNNAYINCTLTRDWTNITSTSKNYMVCGNLTYGSSSNTVDVYAQIFINYDAPPKSNSQATLTFTASTPS